MENAFKDRFGTAQPAVPTDIAFGDETAQRNWTHTLKSVGSGWFMDRFLYLFGAGLQPLKACLDAWSFLVPPGKERLILGRNAYGTLLVLEDPQRKKAVYLLDPLRVVYWTHRDLDLNSLIGREMPRLNLPHFFEDAVYRTWTDGGRNALPDDSMLAPITPLSLGGEMTPDNFQAEEIVSFYQGAAPIYAKAFAKMGKAAGKKAATRKK